MIGTSVLDVEQELGHFDFTTAPRWHVLVLCGSVPSARVDLPSPGATDGNALVEASLVRRADAERARLELIARLRTRLGADSRRPPKSITVSVVVCTHRRPLYLPDLFAGLLALTPKPLEIIVVDNDPDREDCQAEVERAGLRYLREDRRGLDNARNAGLSAARGDVVLFTDDDCVPPEGWLAPLERAFSHEGVAAVTGPAFPYVLDTPARVRMERQASLARGLQRVSFDWQVISPLHAAAMGVGANMAIRRASLLTLGAEPFPPELDAGTETESGGDTYVLSRLLAQGDRVIYEPEMFTFHRHRPDEPALRKALLGYGIGLSAVLTKLLVEERELTAPRAWAWLIKQYWQTQRRRMVGRADAMETRLSWDYLRGGFFGAGRWREALRTQHGATVERALVGSEEIEAWRPAASPVSTEIEGGDGLRVSVVIPTFKREAALRRCLGALARQDVSPTSFEVIVVDDAPDSGVSRAAPSVFYPFTLRRVCSGGVGAAGARNEGDRHARAPILLFLDDDVVADPWLVRSHLQWHDRHGHSAVLVGPYRPRPCSRNLAAVVARLWWQDIFHRLQDAGGTTFVAALTANVSMPRTVFHQVGGFTKEFSRQRREDWEWGLRILEAGVPLAFEPTASARHEFTLSTAQRLRDAQREGIGDVLIGARHPMALSSLPLVHLRPPTPREPVRWIGLRLWRLSAARMMVIWALNLLELGNLREVWMRVFRLAQSAAYAQGAHEGGWRRSSTVEVAVSHSEDTGATGAEEAAPTLALELLSDESVPAPTVVAPQVRVTLRGAEVARISPSDGIWGLGLAEQIVDAIPPEAVSRVAAWGGWLTECSEAHAHCGEVEVIFGPASEPSDLLHRQALEELGAVVKVLGGASKEHWSAVSAAVQSSSRPLVAIPLPGTSPGPDWLLEALSAFDGERVGLVFGGCVSSDDPRQPLYLHDRESTGPGLLLNGDRPAYLVARRQLAAELRPTGDMLGPVMSLVTRALNDRWVIGHRSVHGLAVPTYSDGERGEAYGRLEVSCLAEPDTSSWLRSIGKGVMRGLMTMGWQAFRQRGHLTPAQRQLAAGVARGVARALLAGRASQ
jgi:glycosyltransferase involved in cell wall biosynthesis